MLRSVYASNETRERPTSDDGVTPVLNPPGATRQDEVAASRHDQNESWSAKAARSTLEDRDVPYAAKEDEAQHGARRTEEQRRVRIRRAAERRTTRRARSEPVAQKRQSQ